MDDTHTDDNPEDGAEQSDSGPHPADEIAALDPAEAPDAAESYAARLAAELDRAGAAPVEPEQPEPELGEDHDQVERDAA
jgi:hypothetical protein